MVRSLSVQDSLEGFSCGLVFNDHGPEQLHRNLSGCSYGRCRTLNSNTNFPLYSGRQYRDNSNSYPGSSCDRESSCYHRSFLSPIVQCIRYRNPVSLEDYPDYFIPEIRKDCHTKKSIANFVYSHCFFSHPDTLYHYFEMRRDCHV